MLDIGNAAAVKEIDRLSDELVICDCCKSVITHTKYTFYTQYTSDLLAPEPVVMTNELRLNRLMMYMQCYSDLVDVQLHSLDALFVFTRNGKPTIKSIICILQHLYYQCYYGV